MSPRDEFTLNAIRSTRRQWLKGFAAWSAMSSWIREGRADVTTAHAQPRGTARTCIFVNLNGGPSQLDTFDIKDGPWNPGDARIEDFAGGVRLNSVLFPNLSRLARELCVLHSMSSWEAAHERGQFYLQTAHPANPAFVSETPHIGAVVSLELSREGSLPPFLAFNDSPRGATFLGGRYEPFSPTLNPEGLGILEHPFFGNQSERRFEEKFALLQAFERQLLQQPIDIRRASHAQLYPSAKSLMYDPSVAAIFRFSESDDRRYGDTQFGRSCIVARNAVRADAGAAFISINQWGWDTHQNMFDRTYYPNLYQLCGELDSGIGGLVDDLKSSGHLGSTLIVLMGEFGRTPGDLNSRGGRDHHRDAQSVALIGGGVAGGRVIGATDSRGSQIIEPGWQYGRPIYIEDLTSTIYSALGIDWTKSIAETPSGRRFEYVPGSDFGAYTAVEEVFA